MKLKNESRKGFSLATATFFIIGELAGGGLLTLPHAISMASWFGIPIILVAAISAGISGYYLAKSWMILEHKYPQYRNCLTRKPFATIGLHSYGKYMSVFVSFLLNLTNTCATIVFISIFSDLLSQLTKLFIHFDNCQWLPIVSLSFLIPLLFGSPIDFWPIAYLATFSTTIGSILLIIALSIQIKCHGIAQKQNIESFQQFSSCFGIAFYAFGGASIFPSFQNDMRNKNEFSKAVIFGFIGLLLLYVPVASFGYASFGVDAQSNILNNFPSDDNLMNVFSILIRCCFLLHFTAVIPITINPVFLDMEELIEIPKTFTWKRAVFRAFMLAFITFLAATFPNFGQVLELIGGTTVTIISFILPTLFYFKLSNDFGKNDAYNDQFKCSWTLKCIFIIILILSVGGGIASTFSTLSKWQPLQCACYLKN